jgi:hypothetical protein
MSGMQMKIITLTHANLKISVDIAVNTIFAYYFSESHKATLIVSTGGQVMPVLEKVEAVREALT